MTTLLKGKNYCKDDACQSCHLWFNYLFLAHLVRPWVYRNNVQLGCFLAALTGIYKVCGEWWCV